MGIGLGAIPAELITLSETVRASSINLPVLGMWGRFLLNIIVLNGFFSMLFRYFWRNCQFGVFWSTYNYTHEFWHQVLTKARKEFLLWEFCLEKKVVQPPKFEDCSRLSPQHHNIRGSFNNIPITSLLMPGLGPLFYNKPSNIVKHGAGETFSVAPTQYAPPPSAYEIRNCCFQSPPKHTGFDFNCPPCDG